MPATSAERQRRLLILPDSLVATTLRHLHDDAGHFDITKTLARVEEKFWWPGYTKDVHHWVKLRSVLNVHSETIGIVMPELIYSASLSGDLWKCWPWIFGPLPETVRGNTFSLLQIVSRNGWKPSPYPTTARVLFSEAMLLWGSSCSP